MSDDQASWRAHFGKIGETRVRQLLSKGEISANDPRHTFALEWLSEQETARRDREQEAYSYTQRTFYAAVVAVIVGVIGVVATLMR